MISLENHKGKPCICSGKFCQEGYCGDCITYDIYSSSVRASSGALKLDTRRTATVSTAVTELAATK